MSDEPNTDSDAPDEHPTRSLTERATACLGRSRTARNDGVQTRHVLRAQTYALLAIADALQPLAKWAEQQAMPLHVVPAPEPVRPLHVVMAARRIRNSSGTEHDRATVVAYALGEE